MPEYSPESVPFGDGSNQELREYLWRELLRVSGTMGKSPFILLEEISIVPDKVQDGTVIWVDGVNFDPGFGAGFYGRRGMEWYKLDNDGSGDVLDVPVTKTADFVVGEDENWIRNNKSGSTAVVTLPAAADFPGRKIHFSNLQAQLLNSNASNVIPLAGGAAGTAILSANAGRWATLISNGTNWVIMAGVI